MKYKIFSLYYTKPIVHTDSSGSIAFGRTGVSISVGSVDNFGEYAKVVESITYDNSLNAFRIGFLKGGLKIIPNSPEIEITYQEEK